MSNVKVLLANGPRMLRESLRGVIDRQPDIEVETCEPDALEMLAAVDRFAADVVIVTLPRQEVDAAEAGEPGICSHLLYEYPNLLIVALSPDSAGGYTYRLVIAREAVDPLSETSLLQVIRSRRSGHSRPASRRTR